MMVNLTVSHFFKVFFSVLIGNDMLLVFVI